ncbi:ComF family protein [Glutamicibacter endophyticus]|uniref:ComF family protein n=1 Tax=Glutamicibacter endophyticus TaxID=1522174 RepID=UPI003AEF5A02
MAHRWLVFLDNLWHARLTRTLVRAGQEVADLWVPASCALCSRAGDRLCAQCAQELREEFSGLRTGEPVYSSLTLPDLPEDIPVLGCGVYTHALARAILAYKNRQRYFLRSAFGPAMGVALEMMSTRYGPGGDLLVVPMPTSVRARSRRGFCPVHDILRFVVQQGWMPAHTRVRPILRYTVHGQFGGAQKGRTAQGRRQGYGKFRAEPPACPAPAVILVDDVLTTGHTMKQAVSACQVAGYRVVGAVVLALTPAPDHEVH